MSDPANVEAQMVGEIDRRRQRETEAAEAVASMTVADLDEAGLRPGPAEDLRQEAKRRTGRRRPSADDVTETAEALTDEQRAALAEAVPDPDDTEQEGQA